MIKESWGKFLCAVLCMIVLAGTSGAMALLIKPILDDIFIKKNAAMLIIIPPIVILLYFIRGILAYAHAYLMNYIGQQIIRELRNMLYTSIIELPLSFFHSEKIGVLMSRITNDVNVVKSMVSTVVTRIAKDGFTIIGLIGVIFYRDWKMALIAMIVLPIIFFPIFIFGRWVRKFSKKVQKSMAEVSAFLYETFTGSKIVKAFGKEEHEKRRFFQKTKDLFKLEIKSVIAKELSSPVMEIVTGIGISFIIWFGGKRVINGAVTTGTFFSFLAAAIMLYEPVKQLNKLNNAIQEGLGATDRIFEIIEKESDIKESENPIMLNPDFNLIEFKNMFFKYNDEWVLEDINLDVNKGEVIALVGMSGGGKTSLVNLIPRFYDTNKGAILIDGADIKELSIKSLRKQIAIVTQEPILFNDTVRSNIAYGREDASEEDIEKAAKAAFAYDFICGFPEKFDTMIGELGSRLSGGEKQRICIARALLKNAPILILDEATSSLDINAEEVVKKALDNLMKGRTTFIIAHRLSTVAKADKIITLINGRIKEIGTHSELLEKKGDYYNLYIKQFPELANNV